MLREVTLSLDTLERTYTVDTETHYQARIESLERFLDENKIPGRPIDYITGRKRGLISITVRSTIDRRTLGRDTEPGVEFYVEQVGKLRQHVRTSSIFSERNKSRATKLLLQLEEVLSG